MGPSLPLHPLCPHTTTFRCSMKLMGWEEDPSTIPFPQTYALIVKVRIHCMYIGFFPCQTVLFSGLSPTEAEACTIVYMHIGCMQTFKINVLGSGMNPIQKYQSTVALIRYSMNAQSCSFHKSTLTEHLRSTVIRSEQTVIVKKRGKITDENLRVQS